MQGEDFHLAVGRTQLRLSSMKGFIACAIVYARKKLSTSGGRDAPQVRFYEGFYRLRYSLNREKVCT